MIEKAIRDKIASVISEGADLSRSNEYGSVSGGERQRSECVGWIAQAEHLLLLVCPRAGDGYHRAGLRIVEESKSKGYAINQSVAEMTALLRRLLTDIDAGLLRSLFDNATAETFDDLLDHADEYKKAGRLEGAGVLSTVVFEDTLRRIARSKGLPENGLNLDAIITSLTQEDVVTSIVAKRCRAAAGVRNSALHAHWSEFSLEDVDATIVLTRSLLANHLTT